MIVRIRKATNKKTVYNITNLVTSLTWSGSDKQTSRRIEMSLINSPFDGNMSNVTVESGDIVYFYFDDVKRFVGRVLTVSTTASPGVSIYTAKDYMNILLGSKVYYNFKNTTPEKIASKILSDLGVSKGAIAKTNVSIKKMLIDGETGYNAIISAYYKAYKQNKKRYMPQMDGTNFCVKEKGESSGVKLKLTENVTDTSLEENAEGVINKVLIYDENGKKVGTVSDDDSIKLFGIYQEIYKKEQGVNATTGAKALLKSSDKTAKVCAIGDINCTAGKSVYLYDDITGLWGKFYIENDSHKFENGTHTMDLDLVFKNIMEGDEAVASSNPIATEDKICYYTKAGNKYHSKSTCSNMDSPTRSTVAKAIKAGKSKCMRCWK